MTHARDNRRDPLDASLEGLWPTYRPALLERVRVLALAILSLRLGTLDEVSRANALRAAHKIAGVAGSFGFWDASELAREAEAALDGAAPIPPDVVSRLDDITSALARQLAADGTHRSSTGASS